MIDHQLRDDAQTARVRRIEKRLKILQRSVARMHVEIIRDVVTVIAQRRRIKRQQPDRGDAELVEIVELLDQPAKIPYPVAVAIVKGLNMQLVDDCVLVPERIACVSSSANCMRLTLGAQIGATQLTICNEREWQPLLTLVKLRGSLTSLTYRGASIDWLATHFHVPSRLTQVSVKRNRYWTTWPARLRLS